jgi:hypothetical protein
MILGYALSLSENQEKEKFIGQEPWPKQGAALKKGRQPAACAVAKIPKG